jgi:hypothetical protein
LNGDVNLYGYIDFDWETSAVDWKSTSGCFFSLGSGIISWLSRKKTLVALSTTKKEYIATSVASHEAVWLQKLFSWLFDLELEPTLIYRDNQICVKLSKNLVFDDKLKHIEIKYHYIRDMVQRGAMELRYISTDEKIADILTKPLSRVKYEYFRENLGVMQNCHPC